MVRLEPRRRDGGEVGSAARRSDAGWPAPDGQHRTARGREIGPSSPGHGEGLRSDVVGILGRSTTSTGETPHRIQVEIEQGSEVLVRAVAGRKQTTLQGGGLLRIAHRVHILLMSVTGAIFLR